MLRTGDFFDMETARSMAVFYVDTIRFLATPVTLTDWRRLCRALQVEAAAAIKN